MIHAFSTVDDARGLEKKFVLGSFVGLALAAVGCYALAAFHTSLFVPALLIVSLCALSSVLAHYLLFRPLTQLVVMARAIGIGDFTKRLGLGRRDEIGHLALEMDTMCDQLEAARFAADAHIAALEQLRHSDRIATLGRLASSVAHE
ncbi:MAG TPA: HAMP domain-containing protein, partial [Polyangiales bacterium]|nr:HAMP domain-containing protein [Polyangiales bacterium]